MSDAGLQINVGANVSQALAGITNLNQAVIDSEKELAALGLAIDHALDKDEPIAHLEDAFQRVSDRIKLLKNQISGPIAPPIIPPIQVPDDSAILNSVSKQRIAFIDLGRIITGQGFSLRSVASNFSLFSPAIVIAAAAIGLLAEQFLKQSDAEKKAAEDAKKLKEFLIDLKTAGEVTETSTGSETGNIARVQALAAAIEDTSKSYKERNNALLELRETNKNYFGDLSLEASSLQTLSDRVKDYSNALITEAIVKGQVDEIAKVSQEYQKQIVLLKQLTDGRDKLQSGLGKVVTANQDNFGGSGAGSSDVINYQNNLDAADKQVQDTQKNVNTLKASIDSYTDSLNKNISEQIKQKPLSLDPHTTDELKADVSILEEILRIRKEIATPSKEPLFKQEATASDALNTDGDTFKLFQAKIADAIQKGIKDPKNKDAYAELAKALQDQLAHTQNPNLHSVVQGTVDVTADDADQLQTKIEKAFGGSKGLQVKVPVSLKLAIEDSGLDKKDQEALLKKAEEDALKGLPPAKWVPDIQVEIDQKIIAAALSKELRQVEQKVALDVAKTGFKDVGIAIGDALSGAKSPLQNAIKDFTTVLGDGLIKIGEQMVLASTLMQGLKAALGGLFSNPVGGIVEGIAAIALGEVVKNVGAHAFAEGGIVTGPTYGLVGEAGPEVIFPLDRLNRFVKNNTQGAGAQTVRVIGQLSGHTINLAAARASKNQALV